MRFGHLLLALAWKWRGPILVSALHKFLTYLLTYLPTYLQLRDLYRALKPTWPINVVNVWLVLPLGKTGLTICIIFDSDPFALLRENMTSSTKLEVYNTLHCNQGRTEPQLQAKYEKFGEIWTCGFRERQTDTLMTILHIPQQRWSNQIHWLQYGRETESIAENAVTVVVACTSDEEREWNL